MLTIPNWSLRKSLIILLACSILPAVGAILYYGWADIALDDQRVREQALFMARSLGEQQSQYTTSTKLLLRTLSRLPVVKNQDKAAVEELFKQILADNPLYGNLALAAADGAVTASANPYPPGVSLADMKVFQDCVRTRQFSSGEYALSPIGRKPSFHFAMPVFDNFGQLTGVLAVPLPLDKFDNLMAQIILVPGTRATFLDHDLRRIHRIPDVQALPSGSMAPTGVIRQLAGAPEDQGVFTAVSGDGLDVVYGYVRLRLSPQDPPYMTVLVGLAQPGFEQAFTGGLGLALAIVLTVMVLALAISKALSEKTIGLGVDRLVRAADALAAGDFTVRVGPIKACSELVSLGRAFDRMLEEIREREARILHGAEQLAAILDATTDGIYGVDREGRIMFVNPAALKLFGYQSDAKLLGKDNHKMFHHSYPDNTPYPVERCPIRDVLRTGATVEMDQEVFWTANAESFAVQYAAAPILTGGRVEGAVVAFRDITERKRMDDELKAHRDNLEKLVAERTDKLQEANRALTALTLAVEQSPVSVIITDKNGRMEYVNPRFCETTGYTSAECLGQSTRMLKSGEHAWEFYQDLWSTITSGKVWKGDFVNVKKSGERFWENASIAPILDENGQIAHFIAVKLDISLRKRAEEALRDKQKYLSTILESVNTGILLVDLATHMVVDANPAAEALIGASKVELLGKDCRSIACSGQLGVCRAIDNGETNVSSEMTLVNCQGERVPVLKTVKPVEIGGQPCLLETLTDITERKRMEEELRTLAFTDPLTGVNNRRRFLDLAQHELERAMRYSSPFTYLTLDVDHFKAINDQHGHDQGDRVLRRLARTCMGSLRDTDVFGRLGGEEFGAVLIESSLGEAMAAAQRLRAAVESDCLEAPAGAIRYTVSIGICTWRAGDDSLKEIMKRADKALYVAKAQGRNRVVAG